MIMGFLYSMHILRSSTEEIKIDGEKALQEYELYMEYGQRLWSVVKQKTNGLFGLGSQDRSGRGGEVLLSEMSWSGKMNWTAVLITERGRDLVLPQSKQNDIGSVLGLVLLKYKVSCPLSIGLNF